ncbi:hypothetical protein CF319_g4695 [Tilletia indica]|nr:hypothetical protein CF319_g4695 [Tilletia indica]
MFSSVPSPSTLQGKRLASKMAAAAANSMSDKENQNPNSLPRSDSNESVGFRPAGKFGSNSSLSIAIHPPSKSNSVSYRLASTQVELPPTPITAGLDTFPQGKSPSPALLSIELPLTPTSAGFPSSPASSYSQNVELPSLNDVNEFISVEFEAQLRSIIEVPATPKIGACESGTFSPFPASPASSLSDIMTDFPPHLSDAEESMLDFLHDDIDEDDDEHEAQTPVKHFIGMSRSGPTSSSMGMSMSGGVAMQREATVSLISTPAQLEMQTALRRRMDDQVSKGKGKSTMQYADLSESVLSNLNQLGLNDHPIPFAIDNGLGLSLGNSNVGLPLPNEVAAIILEASAGLPQAAGLKGLGITLQGESSKPTLAPPGQIVSASSLPKHAQAMISEDRVSVNAPWQQSWQDADLHQQQRVRVPLSESRRSSNATATPLSVVAVNRSRLGSGGLTPTNSPSTKPLGSGTPTSPAKRSATAAALSSHLYLIANGKENQDPLSPSLSSSSSSSSSGGSGFKASMGGPTSSPALSQSGNFARKRSRIAMR